MHIILVGLNHQNTPIEVREKLAFRETKISEANKLIFNSSLVLKEVMIVTTCNRVEIYAACEHPNKAFDELLRFLCFYHRIPLEAFEKFLYYYQNDKAVEHLLKVACGLDSLILGEDQILGQIKRSHQSAVEACTSGTFFNKLMPMAINTGKRARSETGINKGAVSVCSEAVNLANSILKDITDKTLMIVGAGKIGKLAALNFLAQGIKEVLIFNRTKETANLLAKKIGGNAVVLNNITEGLLKADIIISSTGAPHYIIKKEQIVDAQKLRKKKTPLVLIDLAVPRDIDPNLRDIEGIILYDIDDFKKFSLLTISLRKKEASKVSEIIKNEVCEFKKWKDCLEIVPVICAIRKKAEDIRKKQVSKASTRLKNLTEKEKEVIEIATKRIVNKILHDPIINLKSMAAQKRSDTELIKELFNIKFNNN